MMLIGLAKTIHNRILYDLTRRLLFFGFLPLSDHPPPKPPFQCPHPNKNVIILLLYDFCIHLHTHQDLKLQYRRVMGQKLRYGRPCPHDSPGTHNWLAQLHIASFFQNSTILYWHNPGSLDWITAPLAWLTPRPAPERLCLWLLDMYTDPLFTQFAQKGWQSTGLELRIPMIC